MHRCPIGQSREVVQAVWHLRNAHTSGEVQSVLIEHPSAIAASGGASDPEQEIRTNSTNSIRPARPRRTRGGIMIAGESLSLPPFVNGDRLAVPAGYFTTEPTSCSTCSPADWYTLP